MLPAAHRLLDSGEFRRATRAGRRARTRTLVLHLAPAAAGSDDADCRVGFVVSRAVGTAVVRNRVRRRLRHLVREQLPAIPAATVVVVRALPAAAHAGSGSLGDDLSEALRRCVARDGGAEAKAQT